MFNDIAVVVIIKLRELCVNLSVFHVVTVRLSGQRDGGPAAK